MNDEMITFEVRYELAREILDELRVHTSGFSAVSPLGVLRYEIALACKDVEAAREATEQYWHGYDAGLPDD